MYNITREYYRRFPNVKTVYYAMSSVIEGDTVLKGDILYCKGIEGYVPNILDKTITTFRYFENDIPNYDYVIRSNVSTIINFSMLEERLKNEPVQYSGGEIVNLKWLDAGFGVKDKTMFGMRYGSGTSIIFSKSAFIMMMRHIHNIRMDYIDDLSIGILFHEYLPEIIPTELKGKVYLVLPDISNNLKRLTNIIRCTPYIFYRNKNSSRAVDVIQMRHIISVLDR